MLISEATQASIKMGRRKDVELGWRTSNGVIVAESGCRTTYMTLIVWHLRKAAGPQEALPPACISQPLEHGERSLR